MNKDGMVVSSSSSSSFLWNDLWFIMLKKTCIIKNNQPFTNKWKVN